MSVWTERQDDQAAFEEAMEAADIAIRQFERGLAKLRIEIERLGGVKDGAPRARALEACLLRIDRLAGFIQTPPLSQWRQKFSEGRGRRHSQQHVLECKLAVARKLLAEHGIDLDAVHVSDRSPAPSKAPPSTAPSQAVSP